MSIARETENSSPSIKVNSTKAEIRAKTKSVFIKTFVEQFKQYKKNVLVRLDEHQQAEENWKDMVRSAHTASASGRITAAVLGGLSLVSIPGVVSNVTTGAALACDYYREKGKLRECERAMKLMDRDTFAKDIKSIAKLIVYIYQVLLDKCTDKGAAVFANVCCAAITYNMQKNKSMRFDELLRVPSLQGLLVKSVKQIPKINLEIKGLTSYQRNTRDVIKRPALYCEEDKKFYRSPISKSGKYDFLTFKTLADIHEFERIVQTVEKSARFTEMTVSLANVLKKESFLGEEGNVKSEEKIREVMSGDCTRERLSTGNTIAEQASGSLS